MTVITHPSADPLAPSAIADEGALKLLFDEQYEPLRKRAASQLGDASALAPRVVEQVFVRAWRDRAAFTGRDQLLGFLQEETDHGAVRTLNRRSAAHRLGAPGHDLHNDGSAHAVSATTADPDVVWHHIDDAIHAKHDAGARAQAYEKMHHDTAQHIAHATKKTNWVQVIGLFALTAVAVAGALWFLNRAAGKALLSKAVDAADAEIVETMPTQVATTPLVDGSNVKIGADSRIRIPKVFNEEGRAVRAEGLVHLEVKAAAMPFQVFVGRAVVTVTGTTLTTRWFPDDSVATVTLQEGTADVKVGDETRSLAAGAGLVIPREGAMRDATASDIAGTTSWLTDTIVVENRPLKLALQDIRRWFGQAIVADTVLMSRPVSFRAPVGQIRDAIAGIEQSGKVKFGYVGMAMVFSDPTLKK